MKTDIGYIYVLSLKSDGAIKYVGKTVNPKDRLRRHLSCQDFKKNVSLYKWVYENREKVQMEIVEIRPLDEVMEAEDFYINYFRSLGFTLFNRAPTGYSTKDYKYTEEQKKQISKATRKTFESKERRIKQSRALGGRPIRDHLGKYYESAQEAARELGLCSDNVRGVLYGRYNQHKGYAFAYADQPLPKLLTKEEIDQLRFDKQKENGSSRAPIQLQDQFGNVYQSLKEAAERFEVSSATIRNHLKNGKSLKGFFLRRQT